MENDFTHLKEMVPSAIHDNEFYCGVKKKFLNT